MDKIDGSYDWYIDLRTLKTVRQRGWSHGVGSNDEGARLGALNPGEPGSFGSSIATCQHDPG